MIDTSTKRRFRGSRTVYLSISSDLGLALCIQIQKTTLSQARPLLELICLGYTGTTLSRHFLELFTRQHILSSNLALTRKVFLGALVYFADPGTRPPLTIDLSVESSVYERKHFFGLLLHSRGRGRTKGEKGMNSTASTHVHMDDGRWRDGTVQEQSSGKKPKMGWIGRKNLGIFRDGRRSLVLELDLGSWGKE
jgi:hypothetical protein